MSRKRKPRETRVCVICGETFTATLNSKQKCCSRDCSDEYNRRLYRQHYAEHRDERIARRAELDRAKLRAQLGISAARMSEIDAVQDSGDSEIIRAHAATWSRAERKYARDRYCQIHGLFRLPFER